MIWNDIFQVLAGFVGTIGFAVLFNIRGKRLLLAGLGGLFAWALFLLVNGLIANEAAAYFIVAMLATLYAELMARVLKTPTTTFITTSLIPLIPGGSLYYTMAYAFQSDAGKFVAKALSTLQLASALALGIIVATTFTSILFRLAAKMAKEQNNE